MCHSKSVREVTEAACVSQMPYFLGAVTDSNRQIDQWTVEIVIGATPVKYKIEKGADLNVIEKETFNMLISEQRLVQSNIPPMNSPGGQLNCMGKFQANATYKEKHYSFPVYVIHSQTANNLLCKDTAYANGLVKRTEITAKLSGTTMFTSLDAASGFWQMHLHPESSKLATFITPFGRHAYKRLPFGITSAPEIFHRKMAETLGDLEGVAIYMDDVLVFGDTAEQHDQQLN